MKDFLLRAAVRKLHAWVNECIDNTAQTGREAKVIRQKLIAEGSTAAYVNMQYKMRTLFAGLIDFHE